MFPAKEKDEKPVIEFSTSPLSQFFEPFERLHKEIEDTDVSIFAHAFGNSKFGFITFDTSDPEVWEIHYDLIVDGKKIWQKDWIFTK